MTDTYDGKPIAEMSKKELQLALLKALLELEQHRRKYNRLVKLAAGSVQYGSERRH